MTAPNRNPDEMRAKLLASSETREIAKQLGVSVEDYVNTVMEYALDPSKQPQLELLDDEELEELPPGTVPSVQDVQNWLQAVANGEKNLDPAAAQDGVASKSEVESARKALAASGVHSVLTAPKLGEEGSGKVITLSEKEGADLRKQIMQFQNQPVAASGKGTSSSQLPSVSNKPAAKGKSKR